MYQTIRQHAMRHQLSRNTGSGIYMGLFHLTPDSPHNQEEQIFCPICLASNGRKTIFRNNGLEPCSFFSDSSSLFAYVFHISDVCASIHAGRFLDTLSHRFAWNICLEVFVWRLRSLIRLKVWINTGFKFYQHSPFSPLLSSNTAFPSVVSNIAKFCHFVANRPQCSVTLAS